MATIDNLDIQITTSLSKTNKMLDDLIKKLGRVSSALGKINSSSNKFSIGMNGISNTTQKATKSTKSLASTFGTLYANFFWVIRGIKKFNQAITSTADYIEAFNYFEVSFNKIAKDWDKDFVKYGYQTAEEYAESFNTRSKEMLEKLSGVQISIDSSGNGLLTETGIKNLGLNIQEVTEYAAQLASVTNSVGLTGETSLAASGAFTKLAGDISSLFNIDYSSVATNLQSGLIGQSRALYKYGIDITNATLQTYAYELGLEKAVSEMTQAEKMQLRMIAILDQSKVSWGDLANTINSPSNMIRQLTNNLKEAGMMLGQLFIPLLTKVMPIINGVTIAIKRLLSNIAGFLGIKIDLSEFGQGGTDVGESFDDLSDSLDDVSESAKKAKAGLRGFDELKTINVPTTSTSSSSGATSGSIDLTDEILKATAEYEKVWEEAYNKMEQKAEEIADKVEKILEPIRKLFEDISIGDWFAVGGDVSNIVSGIFNFVADAIDKVDWYALGKKIGDFFAGINWTEILSSVGRAFWEGLNGAIDLWKGAFDVAPIETAILTSILFLPKLNGVISNFANFIGKIAGIIKSITTVFQILGNVFSWLISPAGLLTAGIATLVIGLGVAFIKNEDVRESFGDAIEDLKNGAIPLIELFANTILPDLQKGWENFVDIIKPFGDFLDSVFVSLWQDFINPTLTYLGETIVPSLTSVFENLWNKILVPLAEFIGSILSPVIEIVSDLLSMLWQDVVVPLGGVIGNVLGSAFEGLVKIFNDIVVPGVNGIITIFSWLWNNVLSPIVTFLWNNLKPAFETVFGVIGGIISGLGVALGGIIDFIVGVFTRDLDYALGGVKDIFNGIFNAIVSIVEGCVNLIIDALNLLTSGINLVSEPLGDKIGVNLKIPKIKKISIPRYEVGGFPEKASLFWANERGIPELVGTMGGRTAVASGAEITGITDAIYTTGQQETNLMQTMVGLLRIIAEKDYGVTDDQIGKSARRYAQDYFNRTGKEAYSF